jgi:hypothetical protein
MCLSSLVGVQNITRQQGFAYLPRQDYPPEVYCSALNERAKEHNRGGTANANE